MTDVKIALTGFGNVGQGVATLLSLHGDEYRRRYGVRLILTGVADRGGGAVNPEGLAPEVLLQTKREHATVAAGLQGQPGLARDAFLDAAKADVLVEAASTNFVDAEPGWRYAREAFVRGMDVVFASKGALVLHFSEVEALAREHRARFKLAGTIGAPLPVLELADRALVGTQIHAFEGVVNATANVILEAMSEGASYEQGVRRAQEAGVAETDPTLDVDGWDASAKVVILCHVFWGLDITMEQVQRIGIRDVTAQMLLEAAKDRRSVKLVAGASYRDGNLEAWVRTEARAYGDPLGRLGGLSVGMVLATDPLGEVALSVQDSGALPTALTVIRDAINLARERGGRRPEER
ncbi:MAG: hypothetical protein ACRDFS_06860 [Chloroflexota bacterium]